MSRQPALEPSSEIIVVYRLGDLPSVLRPELPEGCEIERCLFHVAAEGSPAVAALFTELSESAVDLAAKGMAVSERVTRILARGSGLASLVRPADVPRGEKLYLGTYSFGFHAGGHEEAERFLLERGAMLVHVRELLESVAIVQLRRFDGELSRTATLRATGGATSHDESLLAVEPGLFALDLLSLGKHEVPVISDDLGGAVDAGSCASAGVHTLRAASPNLDGLPFRSVGCLLELGRRPQGPEAVLQSLDRALRSADQLEMFVDEEIDAQDTLGLFVQVWRSPRSSRSSQPSGVSSISRATRFDRRSSSTAYGHSPTRPHA